MTTMRRPFAVNSRQIWLSEVQLNLLMKMRPDGVAARDENGRLILECADGSSRPCGFDPQGVREQIVGLENDGLLVSDPCKRWSLTDSGRKVRAELVGGKPV